MRGLPGLLKTQAAVFFAALAILSFGVWKEGLATPYVDPVGRIAAQDEAVYSHIALRMAERNEWLTPVFLGRYALFKPPLLYWASAASVKLFGRSEFALRLPSLVAGALVATLLFGWMPDARAGGLAALLLISDPLWRGLSRVALTDAMLALWVTLAVRSIGQGVPWAFSVATAAAVMTKGIAGLIPVFVLAAWWVVEPRRPSPWKWIGAGAGALLLAAPWFLYQWYAHPRWFWAEFVEVEILGFSVGSAVPQTSEENQIWFYLWRLLRMDWMLIGFAAVGSFRTRLAGQRLLAVWVVVGLALVLANQYRNVAYLAPILPALAWIGAGSSRHGLAAGLVAAVLAFRLLSPVQAAPIASARLLAEYAAENRGRELILIDPDDQFLATTYPIRKLRYCFLGNEADYRRYALDFRYLGIALSVDEFLTLDEDLYRRRLREWDLDSSEPIATVIVAKDAADAERLRQARPEADFLVREGGVPKLLLAGR